MRRAECLAALFAADGTLVLLRNAPFVLQVAGEVGLLLDAALAGADFLVAFDEKGMQAAKAPAAVLAPVLRLLTAAREPSA